jgi:hypothetical protein
VEVDNAASHAWYNHVMERAIYPLDLDQGCATLIFLFKIIGVIAVAFNEWCRLIRRICIESDTARRDRT